MKLMVKFKGKDYIFWHGHSIIRLKQINSETKIHLTTLPGCRFQHLKFQKFKRNRWRSLTTTDRTSSKEHLNSRN